MIDHTGVNCSDFSISKVFYQKALAPLGYEVVLDFAPQGMNAAGFGEKGKPDFWLGEGAAQKPPVHIAFRAASRKVVDAFYAAALASGGKDNGAPGLRPQYHPNYYGAFVLDPDGHNIEAVCHEASP
jgi:catechol 2,3-dioxygenase-like lactoylglutathione lyase family enzyme